MSGKKVKSRSRETNRSLNGKILRSTTLNILVVVAVCCVIMSAALQSLANNILLDCLQPMARQSSKTVEANIHMLADRMMTIAGDTRLTTPDETGTLRASRDEVLTEAAEIYELYAIALYDRQGRLLQGAGSAPERLDGEFFALLQETDNLTTDASTRFQDQLAITMGMPVKENGETTLYVLGVYKYDTLHDVISNINLGRRGTAYMVNHEGDVAGHPDQSLVLSGTTMSQLCGGNQSVIDRVTSDETGASEFSVDGKTMLVAFSPIREKDGELTGALVLGTFTEDRELSGLEIAAAGGAAALSRALRQPLYEIFGTLSTMGRRMLANGDLVDEDKEYKKYIESINGAAYQILRNSDNLTAYLGACSDYHPEKEVVNFWSRMAELLDACAIALHNNATPFSFQLPRSDVRVRCRFREMEEALMNLISNAYGSARSQNQVVVIGRDTPEGVVVEVSDHGRGILPEEQEKVFSPFYSKGEKGEAFAGMGLGMTVARQKICGNGGTIVMNSVPGEGTTVAFTLPVCEEPLTPRLAMESGSAPYLQSRYSSVYVGLCSQATLPPQY